LEQEREPAVPPEECTRGDVEELAVDQPIGPDERLTGGFAVSFDGEHN
jgi:hypothetical protein